jgi:hypothetical protein
MLALLILSADVPNACHSLGPSGHFEILRTFHSVAVQYAEYVDDALIVLSSVHVDRVAAANADNICDVGSSGRDRSLRLRKNYDELRVY